MNQIRWPARMPFYQEMWWHDNISGEIGGEGGFEVGCVIEKESEGEG